MRAVSPVVGTVFMLVLVVLLATTIGTGLLSVPAISPVESQSAAIEVTADATTNEVTVRHRAGPSLVLEDLRMQLTVADDPLAHQPPVPFFSARGFDSGPRGAFNPAGTTTLRPGDRATLSIAATNTPTITPGDTVRVALYDDDRRVAVAETTAT